MAARNSPEWELRGAAIAQATVLRERLAELAPLNDEVYEHALAALKLPDAVDSDSKNELIGSSLERAAAFPLAIAEAAANVAELAAVVAEDGASTARGDATAAAMLALGATRAAARSGRDQPRCARERRAAPSGDPARCRRGRSLGPDARHPSSSHGKIARRPAVLCVKRQERKPCTINS